MNSFINVCLLCVVKKALSCKKVHKHYDGCNKHSCKHKLVYHAIIIVFLLINLPPLPVLL